MAGKGTVVRWERIRRQNHWFDALYNACCAGHGCGVRLVQEVPQPSPPPPSRRRDDEDDAGSWVSHWRTTDWLSRRW